ncbi:SAM and SH3 domain-containing protein 3-like [Megalops cyprinoides]|uniref:SAM and SH3 domain-containing protein 3-like n=1 Tax=Megalops cyprinoides TaxID=118141 RepID=UPI00186543E8|nr:SAM and SH3 domain-containing protein 3-like [Megalops cyprinoides]
MLRRKPSNASEKEHGEKKKLSLQRSSSFKDFMKSKPSSPMSPDKQFTLDEAGETAENTGKSAGKLGRKWRNVITRTMTRKTSKMVQKTLAEEGMESAEEGSMSPLSFDGTPDLRPGMRSSVCSTGSEDTMHSPIQRQISGCGDRSSLDSGYSQRDSMRLEDVSPPYNGPFCGRALVHTDFTPSPYDLETLKLQKGDIIDIIEKPPVGTWTGRLNNKVGSFKFIYVTILPEEATPPRRRRRRCHSNNCRPKPKSLEEVLESINLTELSSLLSMHGFQSLEDFRGLKETHLNELNITDPEQCSKLLTAVELLHDYDSEDEDEVAEEKSAEAESNVPRDSGCFESSENLENGREEPDLEPEPQKDSKVSLSSVQEQMQGLTVEDEA